MGGIASIKDKTGDCPKAGKPTYQHLPAEDQLYNPKTPPKGAIRKHRVVVRKVRLQFARTVSRPTVRR